MTDTNELVSLCALCNDIAELKTKFENFNGDLAKALSTPNQAGCTALRAAIANVNATAVKCILDVGVIPDNSLVNDLINKKYFWADKIYKGDLRSISEQIYFSQQIAGEDGRPEAAARGL